MKHSSKLLAGLAASILVFSAQAGVKAADVPRITNGGSGVIGGVDPAAYPRQVSQSGGMTTQWNDGVAASNDASGMVNGRRAMPQAQAQSTRDTARMGAGSAQSGEGLAARHPAWGTPD
ncbi:MAG: hypothetical protein EOO24_32415 [Comamonadaceae bacterium]|nr:MAG: hypothetical protein EOO24_32415 [Comamonadaceae bacterium]